jgi:hypothetical protein
MPDPYKDALLKASQKPVAADNVRTSVKPFHPGVGYSIAPQVKTTLFGGHNLFQRSDIQDFTYRKQPGDTLWATSPREYINNVREGDKDAFNFDGTWSKELTGDVRRENWAAEYRKLRPEVPAGDLYRTLLGRGLKQTIETGKEIKNFKQGGTMTTGKPKDERRELLKRGVDATAHPLPFKKGGKMPVAGKDLKAAIDSPPAIEFQPKSTNPYGVALARVGKKFND